MTGGDQPKAPAPRQRRKPRCPVCKQPALAVHQPFCSRRCAEIDLGHWLKGSYVIPGGNVGGEESESGE